MKLAGMCDRDTAIGLRLTGLQDVSIPEKNGDTVRIWNELSTRDDVGVIFITEAIAEELGKLLAEFRLRQTIPIIVEIPDKKGRRKDHVDYISYLIKKSVGIDVEKKNDKK
jgi:V/A-type H+-transporting ATPase subunit F